MVEQKQINACFHHRKIQFKRRIDHINRKMENNACCHAAKTAQERPEERDPKTPQIQLSLCYMVRARKMTVQGMCC